MSPKLVSSLAVILVALLAPICISAKGADPSIRPKPVVDQYYNDLYSAIYDYFENLNLTIRKYLTKLGRMFNVDLYHLAEIQNFVHKSVSEFTVEACATKENRGLCVYKASFDIFKDGVRNCSIYTVGECDEDIKSYIERGCTHMCKLLPDQPPSVSKAAHTPSSYYV